MTPEAAVEAAATKEIYLVNILHDAECGDGFEYLDTFPVSAKHEDEAAEMAFDAARSKYPNAGDLNLGWLRPSAGQIVAGGDLRFAQRSTTP